MNFFKKKGVAVISTVLIVIVSTLLSFNIRFGSKCQDITNGFYDGVYYEGEFQESSASHLKKIIKAAEEISTIASSYDIDVSHLDFAIENLNLGFRYSADQVSYIHYCYADLMKQIKDMQSQLRNNVNAENEEALAEYKSLIDAEVEALETTGYNESVREFMRDYGRFPVTFFADFADIRLPEYFA